MAVQSGLKRFFALVSVLGLLLIFLVSGADTVAGSGVEGDTQGEGKNKAREDYCIGSTNECGSFCFWAQCTECPQCCESPCSGGSQVCGDPGCEYCYDCNCSEDEEGNESCDICCDPCDSVDCATGCCNWMWRMYQQGTSVDLNETLENPRLGQAVSAAVSEPLGIQDCVADGGRVDKTYDGTTPDVIATHPPDWYGTREPVGIPRKVPVPHALHEYPGSVGAPVLQDVLQDGTGAVTLVTSEPWDLLEYRVWPYGGRVPNDRLPDIDESSYTPIGLHWGVDEPRPERPDLPQRSLLSQWKEVPPSGILPQPKMVFLYEMFDWSESHDFKPPWGDIGNLEGWFPDKQQIMRRNYYDWGCMHSR